MPAMQGPSARVARDSGSRIDCAMPEAEVPDLHLAGARLLKIG